MLRSTLLCCLATLALASPSGATVVIERLADPAALWPGHPTCPIGDTDSPAVDGGPIVYHPTTTACAGHQLLLDDGGTLSTVLPPILPGNIVSTSLVSGAFGGPSIEGSDIAIRAADVNGDGVWVRSGGTWFLVAKKGTTTIPDSGGAVFGGFVTAVGAPRLDSGRVVFPGGDGAGLGGFYLWDAGTLSKLVDTTDTYPGGAGSFADLQGYALDGSRFYFTASDGGSNFGFFSLESSTLTLIADQTTPIPGGTGTFSRFWLVNAADDEAVVVGQDGASNSGLYHWDGATLQAIVNPGDASPGSGTFGSVNVIGLGQAFPSIDAGRVAFIAPDGDGPGVFLWNGSTIERLASTATPIAGETATLLQMKPDSLSGNTLVFYGATAGGSRTWRATFPPNVPALSPALAWLATLALAGGAWRSLHAR
ncbi:MAG: DUF7453 family protein [Myxococcota bacterium]